MQRIVMAQRDKVARSSSASGMKRNLTMCSLSTHSGSTCASEHHSDDDVKPTFSWQVKNTFLELKSPMASASRRRAHSSPPVRGDEHDEETASPGSSSEEDEPTTPRSTAKTPFFPASSLDLESLDIGQSEQSEPDSSVPTSAPTTPSQQGAEARLRGPPGCFIRSPASTTSSSTPWAGVQATTPMPPPPLPMRSVGIRERVLRFNRPRDVSLLAGMPEPVPSEGSRGHQMGNCRPCAFIWKDEGCANGTSCPFCHLCPPGERRIRKKERKMLIQVKSAARHRARVSGQDYPASPVHNQMIMALIPAR